MLLCQREGEGGWEALINSANTEYEVSNGAKPVTCQKQIILCSNECHRKPEAHRPADNWLDIIREHRSIGSVWK